MSALLYLVIGACLAIYLKRRGVLARDWFEAFYWFVFWLPLFIYVVVLVAEEQVRGNHD